MFKKHDSLSCCILYQMLKLPKIILKETLKKYIFYLWNVSNITDSETVNYYLSLNLIYKLRKK